MVNARLNRGEVVGNGDGGGPCNHRAERQGQQNGAGCSEPRQQAPR
jgi:hypothetical protein